MKQYILSINLALILTVALTTIATTETFAQDNNSILDITTEHASSRRSNDGIINITVKENSNSYSYFIYDKEPWSGGMLINSVEELSESNHSFTNMAKGNYYVCVVIDEKQTHCQTISIKAN